MTDLNAILAPGMLVAHPDHPDWGTGQVQSVIGGKITVNFPDAGKVVIITGFQGVDPLGNVTFRTVTTDADGCYEDFFVSTTGGTWQVTAEYPGGKCEAPGTEGPVTVCWCRF